MRTAMNDLLDFEVPIFAFSHCRDVVAAVSKAGGVGVLGAITHPPHELEVDLKWIESEMPTGTTYGVDLALPSKFVGADDGGLSSDDLMSRIPQEQRDFLNQLLDRYGIPHFPDPADETAVKAPLQVDPKSFGPVLDVAFAFDSKVLVAALGSPPPDVVERAHAAGVVVGAQAGSVTHALRHKEAGVDFVIAQGAEAGGHTGKVSTMVLTPQVVDAVGSLPVLAAGGIGNGRQVAAALALGAAGVWTGSIWLGTEESESTPEERRLYVGASSEDAVVTRSLTGKTCRVLRSGWTDAWEAAGAPATLPMPLQSMLIDAPRRRVRRVAHHESSRAVELLSPVIGQVVGQINTIRPARRVVSEMLEELLSAVEVVDAALAAD